MGQYYHQEATFNELKRALKEVKLGLPFVDIANAIKKVLTEEEIRILVEQLNKNEQTKIS